MTELQQRLTNIVRSFANKKLLIIGDAIADRFLYGTISRVSREAPVFILKHEQTETVPGGAANCAVNLAALGADVSLLSIVGNDEAGNELVEKLKRTGVDTSGVLTSSKVQTTTKVRILAGQAHSSRQQVIRIDYEGAPFSDRDLRASLVEEVKRRSPEAAAVIISDYNYGVVDESTVEVLQRISAPVLVDSRFRLESYKGFTAATPNEDEVEHLLGQPIVSDEQLAADARAMKTRLGYGALLVTRGGKGMMLLDGDSPPLQIKAVGAQQPVDVTGAGDTVIATFALGLASGASFSDSARLANYAGGLVVMKRGTASISAQELEHSIANSQV